jgi:uncharacterized lipoprotein YddW (UPF0748 family)
LSAQTVQGIWVVRHSITSPAKVRRLIKFAADNHYTDLFVQVRGRADAYYNSRIVPRASLLPRNDYDPLQDVLTQAHARGIKVHAWVNMYLAWSARSLPSNSRHIVNLHPDWVEVNGRGKSDLEFVAQNGRNGREGIYLSPANQEVNDYLLTVITEIVRNYDVDGIHLDYFRYINPCGFVDKGVTSLEKELGEEVSMEAVKNILKQKLSGVFGFRLKE